MTHRDAPWYYLNWSGIVGAIRNRRQRHRAVLARFANLDNAARRSVLTTRPSLIPKVLINDP
jgi:hypothetical protein